MFRPRAIGLLLALTTLLIYLPATFCDFIYFDDPDYVSNNYIVQKGLTWEGIKWAFSGAHASNWHPLTWISHMIDCDLFRLNPAGPHLVNILFHAINTSLLFVLLFRLTQKLWPCAFIAALFAWHPLHVESVAWIAERKDVLSTFFSLLTLLKYHNYIQNRSNQLPSMSFHFQAWTADYFFTMLFFILALLSKPMPVMLPCIMLLLDFWPLKRLERININIKSVLQLFVEKIPLFLISALSCVITVFAQHQAESSLAGNPFEFRVENAINAYAGYLYKMVWPLHLCIMYPLHVLTDHLQIIELLIVLICITLLTWLKRKTSPWLLVGWLWFLITLLPVIGLLQVGSQAMADRYTYFPLIGIFMGITFSANALFNRFIFLQKWLAVAAISILALCVILTENQLRYWRNTETLFSHALTVEDSATSRISFGLALFAQNRPSEAMTQFIIAFKLNPELVPAYSDIARLLYDDGKYEAAVLCYKEALKHNPPTADVYNNLGIILAKLGRFDEATEAFSVGIQVDKNDPQPHFLLGRLLLQRGRDLEAIPHLQEALRLGSDNLETLIYLATVLAADKNPKVRNGMGARAFAQKAVELSHNEQPAALDALAMAYAEIGSFNKAVLTQQQAIKLTEDNGPKDDLKLMQQHLKLYIEGQPWRESFKGN